MTTPASSSDIPSNAQTASVVDWLLLIVIVFIGGASFAMISMAVKTIPPGFVAVGRLWVGMIAVYLLMRQRGGVLPALFISDDNGSAKGRKRLAPIWVSMTGFGLFGYAIPFSIFPWAQQFVPSGLAGVYMAFMPIWTLGMAALFANEKITTPKLIGFALGLVGVAILLGPEAVKGAVDASLWAQFAILLGTICYAVGAVVTRLAPPVRPTVFSAGSLIIGALAATPGVLFASFSPADWSASSIAAVIGLGLFPTGLAAYLIVTLIRRVGAGFMALSNYLTPFVAVAIGAMAFGERLAPTSFLALGVILAGVLISQRKA